MPDFAGDLERAIARGTTLVVADGAAVLGACLLSRDDAPHVIHWLAVRESSRRRGLGSLLLDAIERRWRDGDLAVVTFAQSVDGGEPARRFYESRGFELLGPTEPAPDGGARDLYVLSATGRA